MFMIEINSITTKKGIIWKHTIIIKNNKKITFYSDKIITDIRKINDRISKL